MWPNLESTQLEFGENEYNFQPLTADSRQLRGLKSSVGTLGTSLSMSRHFYPPNSRALSCGWGSIARLRLAGFFVFGYARVLVAFAHVTLPGRTCTRFEFGVLNLQRWPLDVKNLS